MNTAAVRSGNTLFAVLKANNASMGAFPKANNVSRADPIYLSRSAFSLQKGVPKEICL
jgi:hypothetical protein